MKKGKEIFMYSLAAVVVLSVFATVAMLVFADTPTQNSKIVYMALGQELILAGIVVNYFFGSSKGSADKNEMINNKKSE